MIRCIQTDIINELDKTGRLHYLEESLNRVFKEHGKTDTLQKYYWYAICANLFQVCQKPEVMNSLEEKGMSSPEFVLLLEHITDYLYLTRGANLGLTKLPQYNECDIQALTKDCQLPIDHALLDTLTHEIYTICYEVAKNHIDFNGIQIMDLDMMQLTGNYTFYSVLASVWTTAYKSIPLYKVKNVGMWLVVAIVYKIANQIYLELKSNVSE